MRVLAGDLVAVIAPASPAKAERIDGGIQALHDLGYEVTEGRHLRGKTPQYFSGTPENRLEDIHDAFADQDVKAIICSRGGYGSNYLLEHIDLKLIRDNPKPLFAYSDMTVLQTFLLDRAGLVSFHGPMVAADFYLANGVHHASFEAAIGGEGADLGMGEGLRTLRSGKALGVLYGGCLSMLVSMLGTQYAAQTEGKLLFLEDVNAKPYQIDRMLRQMMLAGKLDGVTGIIFGEMLDCTSTGTDATVLDDVILRVLDWFEGPIGIGLRSGHVSRGNVTLPFGIQAELRLEETPLLQLLESAVRV